MKRGAMWAAVAMLQVLVSGCNDSGDDDEGTGSPLGETATPGQAPTGTPASSSLTPAGDDDGTATGDDDASGAGDDDLTVGDDDASSGDDDASSGGDDDDLTTGDDDASSGGGDDDASSGGDDDLTAGDDDASSGGGDDDVTSGDDDASSVGDDDASSVGDDDASSVGGDDDGTGTGDDDGTGISPTPDDDQDDDGYPVGQDCDDQDPAVHPGAAEVCGDGIDNNCDGVSESKSTWYIDYDADTFGSTRYTTTSCAQPAGYVSNALDCNDSSASIYPGAQEHCDGVDEDCDQTIDEDATGAPAWYLDADSDGYGTSDSTVEACTVPEGYAVNADDCDDEDPQVSPAADEQCDTLDNDCDGQIDEEGAVGAPTWYHDGDEDGYGNASDAVTGCVAPAGYVSGGTDCDDTRAAIHPDAEELCNGVDDDCDAMIDDSPVDGLAFPVDIDLDGFGSPDETVVACTGPDNTLDCDDLDPAEPQVVDASARGDLEDGSAASPWTSIQEGIDNATVCVVVYPGTYLEAIDFGGRGIAVTGVKGASETTIDGTNQGKPVVTFATAEGGDAELSGFTLTHGDGHLDSSVESYSCSSVTTCTNHYATWCGGGIYIDGAAPTLHDLLVRDNTLPEASTVTEGNDTYYTYSYGGGICFMNSLVTLEQVDVWSNYADQGGGAYVDESSLVVFREAYVGGNEATDGAGVMVDNGALTLRNVASSWNRAGEEGGGVMVLAGTLSETNVTHGEDDAPSGAGLSLSGAATATVMNAIVYGADTGAGVLVGSGATFNGSYNNIYGNKGGNYSGIVDPTGVRGNISADPQFKSVTANGDPSDDLWTLQEGSPSIDTGNPDTAYNDADGTRADQGAYGGAASDWD